MRTSNPVFQQTAFGSDGRSGLNIPTIGVEAAARPTTMSVRSTALKTLMLLGITISVAALTWNFFMATPSAIMPVWAVSAIGGIACGIIMVKKPATAPVLAPLFAILEGAFVAAFSVAIIAYSPLAQYVGGEADGLALVGQAAGLTMAIAAAMLMAYSAGLIRLRGIAGKIVIVMTVGVMLYYLGAWLVNMIFGGGTVPQLGWDAGPIGIGFSVFVVVLASLNLVLDFQFVEDGVEKQLPKHYEWLAAFGILTTLVWLYIELLRLLVKLRGLSSD